MEIVEMIKADHLNVEKWKCSSLTSFPTRVVAPFDDHSTMLGDGSGYPYPLTSVLRQIYTDGKWFAISFICRLLPIIEEVTKEV